MAGGGREVMVEFDRVSKRYARKGGRGSLRDTIPALARRLTGQNHAAGKHDEGQTWALRDVSFMVRQGEALGIVGHNGAGKSTILKLLAGVTAPTHGRARVNGRSAALIELGAGFHPDLTGRENVYLNGSILGLKRAEIGRKLESIVDFAGLEGFMDTPVKYYSTGMHARLGFSVAAHVEPEVLLIDEVLSVGDHSFQQKCMRRMEEFRRGGITIVFVSHNLDAVSTLCSQAILIQRGRVAAAGAPADVIDTYSTMSYLSDGQVVGAREKEQTWATRRMDILNAQMCDVNGRPATSFSAGEMATLVVRARASQAVHEPAVGIDVRNAQGVIVYATDSAMLGASVGDVDAGAEIAASFPLALNLCRGVYTVHANALTGMGEAVMDRRENVAIFEIAGGQTSWGIADLRASADIHRVGADHGDEGVTLFGALSAPRGAGER